MADFFQQSPDEARAPECKVLPDDRKRLTRYYELSHKAQIGPRLALDWGAVHPGTAPAGWEGLRLVDKQTTDDVGPKGRDTRPLLVLVYEQLPATDEIQVGRNTVIQLEDGREAVEAEFLQFTAGTPTPGTVGSTTAPGDASAYLQREEAADDGALRRIKRTYVHAGTLIQTDETKSAGKLLLRTIVAAKTAPSTPSGYTRIEADTKNPAGVPIYTYRFAKGSGRISADVSYKQNGKLKVTTIRYLDSDDGAAPAGTLVNDDSAAQDGYTLYTKGYAEIVGDGMIADERRERVAGRLVLYHRVRLGSAPGAPAASIGGTVTAVETNTRQEDGFTLYDYRWIEGEGLVSTETRDHLDGAITYTTKRAYGTAVPAAGEFETSTEEDEGFTVYISRGITINIADLPDEVTTRNNGTLTITRKRKINAAPTGTGSVILETAERAEGYTLYTKGYAEIVGDGMIADERRERVAGRLVLYHRVRLGSAPGAPAASIGGSVTAVETNTRQEDGFTLYDYRWIEGEGLVSTETRDHLDGAITYTTKRAYGNAVPAAGEFETSTEEDEGFTVYISRGITINIADLPDEVTTRNKGTLTITRKRKINAAPTGTGSVILETAERAEGYTLYTKAFATGSGLVSTSRREGPLPGTVLETRRAYGTASVPSGVLIVSEDEDDDGYTVYVRGAMQGTPTGHTYTDVATVSLPGVVNLTTIAVEAGTIAVAEVTPPHSAEIVATVTVSYTTTPPTSGSAAYDMSGIRCSVTFVKTDRIFAGTQGKGTASELDVYRVNSSAQVVEYRGCYLASASASGTQTWDDVGADSVTYTSSSATLAIGTGSTSNTASTSGLLRRSVRPVLTALDATIYYEVTEWTV